MEKNNEISVGIFVYNEEENIKQILNALLKQKENRIKIKEIIVVSSACTDNTDKIVRAFSKKNKKIKLIIQKERKGKASAINLFLQEAKSDIVVIESGDTIPKKDCIENLCRQFLRNEQLGLTGARSIPTNSKSTFLGGIIHYWWWMHNELPRFGEMIAFRKNIVPEISNKTAVDEAYIEALVTEKGFEKKQIADAVLNNHGAESFKDLIKQRKRVYIGHKLLEKEKSYSVNSFDAKKLISLTLKYINQEKSLKTILSILLGIFVEFYSRVLGIIDMKLKGKNPYIWDISASTKKITN